jgi:hypothetical protein
MMKFAFLDWPLREGEGLGSGGGAASAAGGSPGSSPASGGSPGGGPSATTPASTSFAYPDYVPADLRGESVEQSFQKLSENWLRQREALSKVPPPGKSADDYKWTPSEKAKPFVGDLAKDQMFNFAREAALKAGVAPQAFDGMMSAIYDSAAEAGLLAKPFDALGEAQNFLGRQGLSEEQAAREMKPHYDRLALFVDGIGNTLGLEDNARVALGELMATASGLRVLDALSKSVLGQSVKPGGEGGDTSVSEAEFRAMLNDPRMGLGGGRPDAAFRAKVDHAAAQIAARRGR